MFSAVDKNKNRCKSLKHPSDEAAFYVDWLEVQRQKCDGDDEVKHHYLLMKPVSRISNQARREEGGQCPREEKRKEVTQFKGQTDEADVGTL